MGPLPTDGSQTEEMVDLLFSLAERVRTYAEAVAAEFDLSPSQAAALLRLEKPIPMNELATALTCDRSNVTGIIDRLERRDLVQRQPDSADRRVKRLVLTQAGDRLRSRLHKRLYSDLPNVSGLARELENLGTLLHGTQETDES